MSKKRFGIIALIILLLLTNCWLAFHLLDAGITQTYMGHNLDDHKVALKQALKLLPVVARPGVSKDEILLAAPVEGDNSRTFEKDGYIWVGMIGLKFNDQGQLVAAKKAWDP